MDIRNVDKNGGVEPNRPKRSEQKRDVLIPLPPRDEAKISKESRAVATTVENLAERARTAGASERDDVVARAMAKLLGGELDSEAVLDATARRLLDAKFLSA